MMVLAAFFETIGIGLIVPFVSIVTNPTSIEEQYILSYLYNTIGFESSSTFIIFSAIVLLTVFLFKNSYLLLFNYLQYRIIMNQEVKLSKSLFKEYLIKPYTFHLERNTSTLLRNINGEVPRIYHGIILSSFQLLTESLIILFIFILLLIMSPIATITSSILLGGSVLLFFGIFRKKIDSLGKEQQKVSATTIQWVNQGLGASKEIKVSGKENFFIDSYAKQSMIKAKNSRYMNILEVVPRLFLETLLVSIVLISMLIIYLNGSDTTQLVSTMALFAMAAFRIMPSINRVVALITTIKYSQPSLEVVYEDLVRTQNATKLIERSASSHKEDVKYTKSIVLNNVSFKYPNQKDFTVKRVSLTIPIGQSVAFIGESGAGKTTIVDIILGLLAPQEGSVSIDDINLEEQVALWQKKIGYIPQSIFLSDDSIRGNIAFGVDPVDIDDEAVWRALEQAKLKEFVLSLPEKLNTSVGERGVRLSGGQRQRIGIARALYHNPEIIFMDEATSALDNETEREIMRAIDGLKGDKTIIIIAHRLSTIENCDTVFRISDGRLVGIEHKKGRKVI